MRRDLKRNGGRSIKSIMLSLFFIVLSAAVIFFLGSTNWKIYQKKASLQTRVAELKKEADFLEQKNNELNKNLSYAKSDDYLEMIARDQLGMKKPGEEVISIQKEETSSLQDNSRKEEDKTWWDSLKSIFIK